MRDVDEKAKLGFLVVDRHWASGEIGCKTALRTQRKLL
jgi:hypothetical protein